MLKNFIIGYSLVIMKHNGWCMVSCV